MDLTIKKLKQWLAELPPQFDDREIEGDLFGRPAFCKRLIAYEFKKGEGGGVVVNPMGSHLTDKFFESVNVLSVFDCRYEPQKSPALPFIENTIKRGQLYRHIRDGKIYRVLCADALLEATGASVVVYQSLTTHEVRVRPLGEFINRFQALTNFPNVEEVAKIMGVRDDQ